MTKAKEVKKNKNVTLTISLDAAELLLILLTEELQQNGDIHSMRESLMLIEKIEEALIAKPKKKAAAKSTKPKKEELN